MVAPALGRGKVDMVPEYLGSVLSLNDDRDRVAADPALSHARLEQAFAPGVSVLAYAPARTPTAS